MPQPSWRLGHRFWNGCYNTPAYFRVWAFFYTVLKCPSLLQGWGIVVYVVFTMPQPILKLGLWFFMVFTMPQPTFKACTSLFTWVLQCPSPLEGWGIVLYTVFKMTQPTLRLGHCFCCTVFTMPQPTLSGLCNAPAHMKAGALFFTGFLQCPSLL